MDLDVLFVGTAGSAPSARRGLPATLVRRGGDRLLFDCGESTQRQLVRSTGLVELEELFITHFHADHVLGLPGMLKTVSLRQRERALTVYGPRGLRALFRTLQPIVGRVTFDVELVELEPNDELSRDGYRIAAYATDHGVTALGYALVEEPRPGAFDPERAQQLGVAPGPDFGRLQDGQTVNGVTPDQVMGEARRGRRPGRTPAPRGRGGGAGRGGGGGGGGGGPPPLGGGRGGGPGGPPPPPGRPLPGGRGPPARPSPATPPLPRPASWPRPRA